MVQAALHHKGFEMGPQFFLCGSKSTAETCTCEGNLKKKQHTHRKPNFSLSSLRISTKAQEEALFVTALHYGILTAVRRTGETWPRMVETAQRIAGRTPHVWTRFMLSA